MLRLQVNGESIEIPHNITLSGLAKMLNRELDEFEWNGMPLCPQLKSYKLAINDDTRHIPFYKLIPTIPHHSSKDKGLFFNKSGLEVKFMRTIRVPDNGKTYPLPPSLGVYELSPLTTKETLLPMYQREAMWMNFCSSGTGNIAVKIGVGNVNALTGEQWIEGKLTKNPQNYVVCPKQLWLDGIKINNIKRGPDYVEDLVRQFVAMPILDKSTIEQQLYESKIIDAVKGGLQIEVYRQYNKNYIIYDITTKRRLDINKCCNDYHDVDQITAYDYRGNNTQTLYDLGFRNYDMIQTNSTGMHIIIKTLTGKKFEMTVHKNNTILQLMTKICALEEISPNLQRLVWAGHSLDPNKIIGDYNICEGSMIFLILNLRGGGDPRLYSDMGVSAGGLINQKIYLENSDIEYNIDDYEKHTITIVNSTQYPRQMPSTPISAETYIKCGFPWYELYDEKPTIPQTHTSLDNIKSIDQIQNNCEYCVCMKNYVNIQFKTCSHKICQTCFQQLLNNITIKCLKCSVLINDITILHDLKSLLQPDKSYADPKNIITINYK